jgi:hypothetical protein
MAHWNRAGVAVLLAVISSAGLGSGCAAAAGSEDPSAAADSTVLKSTTARVGNLTYVTSQHVDGHFTGQVLSAQGELLLKADLRPHEAKYSAAVVEVPASKIRRGVVLKDGLPSFELARDFMEFTYGQLGSGETKYDGAGCDLLPPGLGTDSFHGHCCDMHDDCFSAFSCSAASWLTLLYDEEWSSLTGTSLSGCHQCDANAVSCFAGPVTGPSTCEKCKDYGGTQCGHAWPGDHSGGIATHRDPYGPLYCDGTCADGYVGIWAQEAYCVPISTVDPTYDGSGGDGSGGTGTCFAPGTPVTMADGNTKSIDRIELGDEVLSFNEATGKLEPHRVTHLFVHPHPDSADPVLLINGSLKVTANHSFYVQGKWVQAGNLQLGDVLTRTSGSASVEIASIGTFTATVPVVYNIEVEEAHTYFADGLLVHNMMKQPILPPVVFNPIVGDLVVQPGAPPADPCQDYCFSTLPPSCATDFSPDCVSAMHACLDETAKFGCPQDATMDDATAASIAALPNTSLALNPNTVNALPPPATTDAGAM